MGYCYWVCLMVKSEECCWDDLLGAVVGGRPFCMASLLCSWVWKVFSEISILVRSLICTMNLTNRGLLVRELK